MTSSEPIDAVGQPLRGGGGASGSSASGWAAWSAWATNIERRIAAQAELVERRVRARDELVDRLLHTLEKMAERHQAAAAEIDALKSRLAALESGGGGAPALTSEEGEVLRSRLKAALAVSLGEVAARRRDAA